MAASPLSPPRAPSRARHIDPPRTPGWGEWVLRAPLFWKLLLPQFMLVGVLLALCATTLPGTAPVRFLVPILAVGPVVAILLSAWILRLALQPIDALTRTAQRVAQGDWTARAPASPLADQRVESLATVFNEMLDALAEARVTQRDLSRRVLEAEERERERIAHELYAGTAQTLAGVLIRMRVLDRALDDGGSHLLLLDELTSEVRTALEEVRTVARRLRPPELDELGVRAALDAHARGLAEELGVSIRIDGGVPEDELDPGARLALFRIVQEGLNNAALHSGGSHIDVRFQALPHAFRAEVRDDGAGFDPAAAVPATDSQLGLVGMKERADYVEGEFTIDSAPGRGTVLRLDLPWAPSEALGDPPAGVRVPVRSSGV